MADLVELGFKIDSTGLVKADRDLDRLGKTGEDTERKLTKSASASSSAFNDFGKILASVAIADRLINIAGSAADATKAVLELQRELSISSAALGVSTQSLQVWQSQAKNLGIEGDKIADIFKDVSDKIGDFATTGGGEAADVFKALNLQIADFKNLSPDAALQKMGVALRESGLTQSQKVFLLESIADDASRLLPLLEDTTGKLNTLKATLNSNGTILLDSQIAALADVNKMLTDAGKAWESVDHQIGLAGASLLNKFSPEIKAATKLMQDLAGVAAGINADNANFLKTPTDMINAIEGGKVNDVVTQIKALNTEFKGASSERRTIIRDELLTFYETLKKQQAEYAQAITSTASYRGGVLGDLANRTIDADGKRLVDVSTALNAVDEAWKQTASILNPAYWDDLQPHQKAFWDSLAKGSASAGAAVQATSATASKSVASWLPMTSQYKDEIAKAAAEFDNLDEKIIKAVMAQESLIAARKRGVSPESIKSSAGATGLMQLMPGTFDEVTKKLGMTGASAFNAADNIRAGAAYLSQMLTKTGGDMEKALAAYNAGLGNVIKYNGIPPFKETQNYVANIMASYHQLTGETEKRAEKAEQAAEKEKDAQKKLQKYYSDGATSIVADLSSITAARSGQIVLLEQQLARIGMSNLARARDEIAATGVSPAEVDAQMALKTKIALAELQWQTQATRMEATLGKEAFREWQLVNQDGFTPSVAAAQVALEHQAAQAQQFRQVWDGVMQKSEEALLSTVMTGKGDWSGLVDYMIQEAMRLQVIQPIMKSLFSSGGSGSGGGLMSSIMSIFGFANGGAFASGGVQAYANGDAFHDSVLTKPTMFFANGGLAVAGEAGAEAVMPLTRIGGKLGVRAEDVGNGNAKVAITNHIEIINNTASNVRVAKQEQSTDASGNTLTRIWLEEIKSSIAGDISSRRGAIYNAMQQSSTGNYT